MRIKHYSLLTVYLLLLSVCGCSLLKVQSEKLPDLAPMVQPPAQLVEHERQALDWSWNVVGFIYEHGAEAKSELVGQLQDMIGAARTRMGLPSKPLRAPENVSGSDRAARALISRLARENAALRAAEAEWAAEYEEARGEPVKSGWSLGNLSWLISMPGALIVAGVIFFPGVLLFAIRFVKSRIAAYKELQTAFGEVIGGVQGVLASADKSPNGGIGGTQARAMLAACRTEATRDVIRATRIKLGLKVNPKEIET